MNNKLIYHYTDITAIKSILTSGKLWMTSHEYLNDTQEFKDGYDRLMKSVDECLIKNNHSLSDTTKVAITEAKALLDNTMVLSTSFSKRGDLLSQWRSYCPSEGGFAIGFDKSTFEVPYKVTESYTKLYDCIYDNVEKDRMAKLFGETSIVEHNQRNHFEIHKRTTFEGFIYHWLLLVISAKNKHFIEEDEVRFTTYIHKHLVEVDISQMDNGTILGNYPEGLNLYSKKELSFKEKSNILIPYHEYEIDLSGIKEIIIGPNPNMSLVKDSIEFFIKNLKLEIEVKCSEIPYRTV